ncbi:putative periplasmic protein [Hydrogenimonas sp.]|nr:putative periplasmic protein [Hydrogenimonas sp.]
MKKTAITLLFTLTLFAGQISFGDIDTTVLSKKSGEPVNIKISLVLQGRDIEENRIALMDVIQSALGSFWAETLVTAPGKEEFKKRVVSLADKKYGIEVDFVYITNLKIDTCTLQKLRKLLKGRP